MNYKELIKEWVKAFTSPSKIDQRVTAFLDTKSVATPQAWKETWNKLHPDKKI